MPSNRGLSPESQVCGHFPSLQSIQGGLAEVRGDPTAGPWKQSSGAVQQPVFCCCHPPLLPPEGMWEAGWQKLLGLWKKSERLKPTGNVISPCKAQEN